ADRRLAADRSAEDRRDLGEELQQQRSRLALVAFGGGVAEPLPAAAVVDPQVDAPPLPLPPQRTADQQRLLALGGRQQLRQLVLGPRRRRAHPAAVLGHGHGDAGAQRRQQPELLGQEQRHGARQPARLVLALQRRRRGGQLHRQRGEQHRAA